MGGLPSAAPVGRPEGDNAVQAVGLCNARMRNARNDPMRSPSHWKPPVGLAPPEADGSVGSPDPHPLRFAPRPWSALRGPSPRRAGEVKRGGSCAQRSHEGLATVEATGTPCAVGGDGAVVAPPSPGSQGLGDISCAAGQVYSLLPLAGRRPFRNARQLRIVREARRTPGMRMGQVRPRRVVERVDQPAQRSATALAITAALPLNNDRLDPGSNPPDRCQ
jgi:hypothetical protein